LEELIPSIYRAEVSTARMHPSDRQGIELWQGGRRRSPVWVSMNDGIVRNSFITLLAGWYTKL
jgi:hypothetical protein